jgi:hypothetical protein
MRAIISKLDRMRKAGVVGLVLAACVVAPAQAAAPPSPATLALRAADLPAGWRVTSVKSVSNAQYAKKEKLPLSRVTGEFKRLTAVDADYVAGSTSGSGLFKGIISASSGATICRSSQGAHALFGWATAPARIQHEVTSSTTKLRLVRVATGRRLGDESRLFRAKFTSNGTPLAIYMFLWRRGRVDAALLVGGVAATTGPDDVFRLVTRFDRRLSPYSK